MVAIFTGAGFGFERGSGSVLGGSGLLGSAVQGWGGEGVYVNAGTGNLLLSKQDEFLVGKGPDIGIGRTYNSLTSLADDNNDKWRQSTDRRVYGLTGTLNAVGSTVKRVSGDGTEITYTWDAGASAYVTKDGGGAYDRIVKSGTEWVWTDGDSQSVERYFGTGTGKIKSVTDTNGSALTFAYDGSDRLTTVTSSDGAWTRYDYSVVAGQTNNITQVVTGYTDLATSTAKTLTRTRYGYDGSNRLTTVTVDLTPSDNSVADGATYVTTYSYDGSGRVSNVAQSDGSNLAITYDGSNRVATLVQTASTGVTRTTAFTYNTLYTTVTDPSGQVTRLDYDAAGNLTKITAPPAWSGASQQIVQFAYNAAGDLTSTTDALGQVTAFSSFTAGGLAQTVTDRLSNSVTRTYSAANLLLSETRTGIDASGAAVSLISRFVYNAAGNLRFAVSPEGRVTEYTRDAAGQVTYETVYAEAAYTTAGTPTEANMTTWVGGLVDKSWVQKTKYLYDARGSVTSATSYGIANAAGTEQTSEGASVTSFVYDQAGQLLSSYSGSNTATTYVYDGMGRMTSTTDANGGTTTIAFNAGSLTTTITLASGYVTTKTYNKAGDLVSTTDSGTYVWSGPTNYVYDKLGRVRMYTDGTGLNTYYLYDDAGRLVGEASHYGNLTEYRYDANNRLVGTIYYLNAVSAGTLTALANPNAAINMASIRPAADAQDISSWVVYDAEGRVVQTIAGDGSTTISTYDASGRLQKTTAYTNKIAQSTVNGFITTPPTTVLTPTTSATDTVARRFYDKDGLAIGSLSGEGYLTQNIYDKAGQLTATTTYATITTAGLRAAGSFTALLASVGTSAQDRTSRLVYDGQGLLRYTVDALNQVVRYDYDSAGQKVRTAVYAAALGATSDYTYDNVKSLATSLEASSAKRVAYAVYTATGRLAYSIDALGAVTGFTYDNQGRVIKAVQYASLNAVSSLPVVATMNSWATSHASDVGNRVTRTWYNARGEDTFVVDAEGYVTFNSFDGEGNLVSVQAWDHAISIADTATLYDVNSAVGSDTFVMRTYQYDAQGHLIKVWDGNAAYTDWPSAWGKGTKTTWNYVGNTGLVGTFNRAADTSEQSSDWTQYDHAGRVVAVTQGAWTSDAITSTRAWDGRGNLTSATDARTKTTTYTYDLDGRLKTITDAAGGVTTYDYNAFGEVWKTTDPNGNISYTWYDKLGRATTSRDAAGYLTQSSYTVFGEIANVKRWMTAATGTPAMGTEPTGSGTVATTSFTYDARSQVLSTSDALSQTESYTYNAFGDRITSTNKLTATTSYAYDRLGRLVRQGVAAATTNYTAATGTGTAGSYIATTYAYDARGNRTELKEGYASAALTGTVTALRTTGYVYNKVSQLTSVTHDAVTLIGDDMVTTWGDIPTETYAYDMRGNVIKAVDAGGAQTFSYYDDLDRKTVEIRQLATNAWVYTAYTYDANGNLTNTKVYAGNPYASGTPPLGGTAPATPTSPTSAYRETTFTYDNLNRMLTSSVVGAADGIVSGSWNGSAYTTNAGAGAAAQALTTTYQYDADGNVVKLTDPNGNVTWSWYNALGQKTAQLDGEKYLTKWIYDAEGNVLSETRYNTKYATTPALGTVPTVATNAADRITDFVYDLGGNRTQETRRNVVAWVVNATTGALTAAGTTDSVIQYTYNALGQVTVKTIGGATAAGYAYDTSGRLTTETRAVFTDANGSSVTPTTTYAYDALGDLVGTTQAGTASGTYTAADRTTTYRYGQGGRLLSTTDAEGYVQTYFYDAAGRLKKTAYDRLVNADNTVTGSGTTTVTEARTTTYDLAGRALTQGVYSTIGGTLTRIDFASFEYNAYDQVTRQGSGSNGSGTMWQAQNTYDAAGRLVATNAGDGVWKVFSYDKNGNQTGAIASAGAATSSASTFAGLFASVSNANLNGTWTLYDGRGQASQVIEEGRELTASTAQTLNTYRTYNAFGEIASETNALGNAVTYSYNTMGRKIRSESPAVQITDETGAAYWIRPSEDYYYDLGGRMIATRDASEGAAGANYAKTGTNAGTATTKAANTGNLTTYAYLGASGYDGSQALIATEFHADGGKKQILYDRMGDARVVRDELYDSGSPLMHVEERDYNKLGQLVTVKHNRTTLTALYGGGTITDPADTTTRLVDIYKYDQFGQRIQHSNNVLTTPIYGTPVWVPGFTFVPDPWGGGTFVDTSHWETPITGYSPKQEKSGYDALGRGTVQTDFMGNATTKTYTWDGALTTSIGGTAVNLGGWSEDTSYTGTTRTSTVKTDLYTREVTKRDLGDAGGHVTTSLFDAAGRLTSRTTGSTAQTFQWYNTGQVSQNVSTAGTESYTYDAVGERLSEVLVSGGVTLVDAQASYDTLGRLTWWNQNSAAYTNGGSSYTTPQTTNTYYYDAMGNVRCEASSFKTIDAFGAVSGSVATSNYYYRYDAMNRLVVDKGVLSGAAGVSGTTIVRGSIALYGAMASQDISYDAIGQRVGAARTDYTAGSVTGYWDFNTNQFVLTGYTPGTYQESRELYDYDGAGRIATIRVSQGASVAETVYTGVVSAAPSGATSGTRRSEFTYDLMNRQGTQSDYDASGSTVVYSRWGNYDAAGKLNTENTSNKIGADTYSTTVYYTYTTSGGEYLLGAVASTGSSYSKNSSYLYNATTVNTYQWWDGAQQTTIANTQGATTYTTSFAYDGLGRLSSAYVSDTRPRTISFRTGGDGQIIRRDEADYNGSMGDPHEAWYRFGGRQLAYAGNNGTDNVDLATSINRRQTSSGSGAFRQGASYGTAYTDTTGNYDAVNSYRQGSAAGSYTVQRTGETLSQIAQGLWGDSSLWYKLAEANGMSADAGLVEGQRLTVPVGVIRSKFNASTVKPYDPASAIGDVNPSTPVPPPPAPKKKGCGIGAIFLAIIAVAVTIVTAGAALSVIAPAAFPTVGAGITAVVTGSVVGAAGVGVSLGTAVAVGAGAAAVGSIVSQGIGVMTGIQDKFSWKAVGLAALGGGIGGAVGPGGVFGKNGLFGAIDKAGTLGAGALAKIASPVLRAGLNGMAASGLAQGIGVVTGLQDKFSWAGVAAAGIGAGVGVGLARTFNIAPISATNNTIGAYASNAIVSGASMLANAATRSAIDGTNFGDAVLAALPDTIAQTIGGIIVNGISQGGPDFSDVGWGPPLDTRSHWDSEGSVQGDMASLAARYPGGATVQQVGFFGDLWSGITGLPGKIARLPSEIRNVFVGQARRAETAINAVANDITDTIVVTGRAVSHDIERYVMPSVRQSLQTTKSTAISGLTMALNFKNGAQQFAHDTGAGLVNRAIQTIAHPIDTLRSDGMMVVRAIDGALIAENTPAIVHIRSAAKSVASANAYDVGYATAAVGSIIAPELVATRAGAVGRLAPAAETSVPQVTANRLAGNAFRDEIAAALRAEGRDVSTEVYKSTPFGKRFIDIEVSKDGQVLGGIETKLGGSRYTPAQRTKDWWLKVNDGYIVNVVRGK